jgi:Undecaprenyl-phosphate galactose phosphotransferase WbaP
LNRIAALPNYRGAAGRSFLLPVSFLLILSDLISLLAAFFASTAVTGLIQTRLFDRAPAEVIGPFLTQRVAIVAFLSCPLMGWFAYKKHYTGRRGHWTEVKHILLGVLAIALVDGWVHFALKMQASRLWQGQLWLYAAAFIIAGRCLARRALTSLGLWQRPTLLVGTARAFDELQEFTRSERYLGYDIRGTLDTDFGDDLIERLEDQVAAQRDLSYALIACEGVPLVQLGRIIETLDRARIRYGLIPPLRGVPLLGFEVDHFLGYDFIVLQSHRPLLDRQHTRVAKRCLDLLGASLALLFLVPFMVAIAVLLRLQGSPILYRSRRLGLGGSIFFTLKFHTMRPGAEHLLQELLARDPAVRAEWEANYKLKDDPRVTPLGGFLRRTSLDELPQLFNVLRGEMSLVGPRPLLLEEVPQHQSALHLYTRVRPGITGMWQVSGRDELDYARRMQLNSWYVHNWSLWHDLVILAKTVVVVARRRGAS